MSKMFSANRLGTLLVTLGLWIGISSGAMAQDNFALAIGPLDHLNVFGPKGEQVAEIPIPTIAKSLTVGTTTFQISYGRDADDLLTAVLTPSSSQAQDLHFTVMGKNIDADKEAVVTLTFPDSRHVTIDPGYIGVVTVNSRSVRHHELADDMYAPKPVYHSSSTAPVHLTSSSGSASAPTPRLVADVTPRAVPPAAAYAPASSNPTDDASAAPSPSADASATPPSGKKLYWAEPVTPFHGPAPAVGSNQMKLLDVHGPVTIETKDGNTMRAANGMLLPSGATVVTSANASAAVFMGGVNSARFLPNSTASITQNLNGAVRKTNIHLTKGTVFCRVGKRAGEKQDYQVQTPQGVAAARGTELAVTITEDVNGVPYTVCFTSAGVVTMTDNNGNSFDVTPTQGGQVAFASTSSDPNAPPLSPEIGQAVLLQALTILQPFNTQLNAIGAEIDAGTASPEDTQIYDSDAEVISDLTTLLDSDTGTTSPITGAPQGTITVTNSEEGTTTTTTPASTPPATGTLNTTLDLTPF